MAALGLVIVQALPSCKKEAALIANDDQEINIPSANAASFAAALKPDYVYTLVGDPDRYAHVDGRGNQAVFTELTQMVASDGYLYVLDESMIRKIKISDRTVTTLAGSPTLGPAQDGLRTQARFQEPSAIAMGPDGNIYVVDAFTVRKITKQGMVTTLAGSTQGYQDGPGQTAKFGMMTSIAVDKDGMIYVYDVLAQQIRKITRSGVVSTFTSWGQSGTPSLYINNLSFTPNGTLYASGDGIYKISPNGNMTTVRAATHVANGGLLALDDGTLFASTDNQIQKIFPNGNAVPFAGVNFSRPFTYPHEGPASSIDLLNPTGLVIENKVLYFAVHPDYKGDFGNLQPLGDVIQMIALPKN
jgi:WD40 repeat protein